MKVWVLLELVLYGLSMRFNCKGVAMPSLYNSEYEMLNDNGEELCRELKDIIDPLLHKYMRLGYPLREIDSVICEDIHVAICEMLLRKSIDISRAKRKA